jgi:filamentous hemagglutinin
LAYLDRAPYDPRTMESMLKLNNPEAEITSRTLPKVTDKNVKLVRTKHLKTGIVFSCRGMPIFDGVAIVDLDIPKSISSIKDTDLHHKQTTLKLKTQINSKQISKNSFSSKQMAAINAGNKKIPGYTWHHHEDLHYGSGRKFCV